MPKHFLLKLTILTGALITITSHGTPTSEEKEYAMTAQGTQSSTSPPTESDWGPEWAKRIVWYQIFPERFRNGNTQNDPTLADIKGAYPHDITSPWQIHPWASDWYELQPYERENGRNVWFNIQRRRYGGDIEGIIEKIDYLEDLGVGAIYLNPVFEAPSHHKYDAATYHHIDPNFGPDPEGDRRLMAAETPDDPSTWVWTLADKIMLQLIQELHRRNMRLIFDGVFNHMGLNSWAFQDVVKNQKKSKYRDWFSITSWDDTMVGSKFDYEGWFGVRELPEIREDAQGIVEGPKQYILDATRRWMDPNGDGNPEDGIDGWRLDVAFCIAHPFWVEWRKYVKLLNPEAFLTAEVVEPIHALKPYLKGDEFDAIMNYNFSFACAEYFIEEKSRIITTEFDERLRELRQAFPPGVAYVMQNLFGSHDTNRLGSHIVNRSLGSFRNWGDYFGRSKAENPQYDTRKPNPDELKIQKLLAIFQMTYVGAPMIYYGDEAGMWGANDPCCRKPMVWPDLNYDDEVYLPDGSKRTNPDKVEFNQDLFGHYKKLIHIRNTYEALQTGDYKTLFIDDNKGIYAFSRVTGNETVIVILNNSTVAHNVTVPLKGEAEFIDVLNENNSFNTHNGALSLHVKGQWGRILVSNK